jgi:2-succinyl-5-enolpyruvyl-6-hydroxy-3-cyclohexene-1-carboxylate synthase
MPHPKQHIVDLAEICRRKGIAGVVISSGSRSAPLIGAFYEIFGASCISIVDERSAAYFALGVALHYQKPVALICTSGTAVLNYAPALAEAYYQHVPLLAVTADRPREWVDQQDNQTLRQAGIYQNYIKGSYELPQVITSEDDLWYAQRIINEAVDLCSAPDFGPVHLNVPLADPLYGDLPDHSENLRIIQRAEPGITVDLPEELVTEWHNARSIMILHGQDVPGSDVASLLKGFRNDKRIVLLAENIANIPGSHIMSNSNLVLSKNRGSTPAYPQLLIHSGGQIVSKALTGYLRRASGVNGWRIGTSNAIIDTFKLISRHIPYPSAAVYRALLNIGGPAEGEDYAGNWLSLTRDAIQSAEEAIRISPFCDLQLFKFVSDAIPAGTNVVLGNSSIIRYSQLFPAHHDLRYYSNRGVSGIDGCLSTAAGIAFASKQTTIAILGDLGFLYDSNALWNRKLPSNLKILLINNSGGGIFHILKGPTDHPGFTSFIEAHHPVNIHKLAEAFGLEYISADDEAGLRSSWNIFMKDSGRATLFEVKTNAAVSASAFRKLMGSS